MRGKQPSVSWMRALLPFLATWCYFGYLPFAACQEYDPQCAEPFETIDDAWRSLSTGHIQPNRGDGTSCPGHITPTGVGNNKWYRLAGQAGDALPLKAPGNNHCGVPQPAWLSNGNRGTGRYPTAEEGVVSMIACADRSDAGNPCNFRMAVGVVRCADFFLWRLPYGGDCHVGYCIAPSRISWATTTATSITTTTTTTTARSLSFEPSSYATKCKGGDRLEEGSIAYLDRLYPLTDINPVIEGIEWYCGYHDGYNSPEKTAITANQRGTMYLCSQKTHDCEFPSTLPDLGFSAVEDGATLMQTAAIGDNGGVGNAHSHINYICWMQDLTIGQTISISSATKRCRYGVGWDNVIKATSTETATTSTLTDSTTTTSSSTSTSTATTTSTSTSTTTTTSTSTTTTTSTSTTTTSTTTTTKTYFPPGEVCESGTECFSGLCQTRCCSSEAAETHASNEAFGPSACTACSADGGACYSKLSLPHTYSWPPINTSASASASATNGGGGWLSTFERDEKTELAGPPNETLSLLNFKGVTDQVTFRLAWGPNPTSDEAALPVAPSELKHSSPPSSLKPAGEGLDPGLFDIDPKTGAISALPRRVGNFSMYLIANDGAGTAADVGLPAEFDQVVIRRWDFTVVGKPNFKVVSYGRIQAGKLATGSDTDAPYAASGKIGLLNCTVGTTYRIAPIDKTTFAYQYASGGVGAKVRFTIRNPPPGFFIDPDTGEIQGKPQSESVRSELYTSSLLAIDAGGSEAELEKIHFAVFEQPTFNFVTQSTGQRAERPGVKYSDPTVASADDYFVGEDYAYKVAPLLINKTATTVSFGSVDDVTYTLSSDAPDSFFVQARSGVIFGQFEAAGKVQFSLLAVDKAGKTAVVEQYTFNAIDRGTFRVLDYAHAIGTDQEQNNDGHGFTDPASTIPYAIGETYKFAPVEIIAAEHTDDVLSELEFSLKDAPEGFLINPTDGYIQGTPTTWGEHTMQLFAVDSLNNRALVENITLSIKPKDVDVSDYGPNSQFCEHGMAVDEIAFDMVFTCDCNATVYEGANCEVSIPVASASGDGGGGNTPVVTGATAGAFIFIFFVGLIVYKRRMFAIKMKSFDFKAEIERLMDAGEIDKAADGTEEGAKIPREIKRTHIVMIQQIGEGAFGEVWKAVLDESSSGGVPGYHCAVKTSKEAKGEGADEMLREATVMAQVSGHPNLVSLIGVVTSGVPLLLAISMCEHGSLISLLKERKVKGKAERKLQSTLAERIGFAIDTAKGMAHLTANSFVHRDLAARNVLVDATMQCKVADFGLARGIAGARAGPDTNADGDEEEYYRSRTGTFPVRWTSPEAMQTMRFSEATDVWSFGVVLIEIFTDGSKPYAGMANAAVISKVQGGYRAEQPKLCTDEVYAIMLECWAAKAADRPTFAKLVTHLEGVDSSSVPSPTGADEAAAAAVARGSRQAVAVNDTYMTDEPAPAKEEEEEEEEEEEAGDQYLTVDNNAASGVVNGGDDGAGGADDEYLSVAAGLNAVDDEDDVDFEC